jgi:hypothetical protein
LKSHIKQNDPGHNFPDSPEATAHRSICPYCQEIYLLDTRAEQEISLAFAIQEIPQGFLDQIAHRLDLEPDPGNA